MTFKEIQELLKFINKSDIAEFKVKDGEFELDIRTKHYHKGRAYTNVVAPPPPVIPGPTAPPTFTPSATHTAPPAPKPAAEPAPPSAAPATPAESSNNENYKAIKSPMVGTFYRSSSPEKPVYVKVGDVVEAGSVVCIVEAMKLFNEIETDVSGRIVKVMVEDAQPVEYDQVLFLIDPKG